MQKKIVLTLILLTTLISPALASSPTPDPSLDEVTQNIKKRLQDSAISDPSPSPLSQTRAYVGIVKDVIKDTVILADKDGKKDVQLTPATLILRNPGNVTIKSDSIRIDDYIIAIGTPTGTDGLTGLRLILSSEAIKTLSKETGMGVVTKISKTSLTLQIKDAQKVFALTEKTLIKSPASLIEISDLAVGDTLIYTATLDDDDVTATILMRIQTASL